MLSAALVGLFTLMWLCPSAPGIHTLHRLMVEAPAWLLARADRRHIIFLAVTIALLAGGVEMLAIFGSTDALLAFSFDFSLYLDAVAVAVAIAGADRVKVTFRFVKARFAHKRAQPTPRPKGRKPKEIRARRIRQTPNNDDESAGADMLAA